MRKGNWIPLDKSLARTLPKLRPFSEVEAAFSLSLDYDSGKTVTVSGYSGQWGWSRKRVKNFLEDMGVEIIYPQDTKCKKNQRGHIALHKRDIKGTYKGHKRMIDSRDVQGDGNIKGTYKEHKRNIKGSATIDPKSQNLEPDPKTNPPNPPLTDEPFFGDQEEEPDGRFELQNAFDDCRSILGLSDTEIKEFYSRHSESNKFAEAVQFAVEKTEKDGKALEEPLGFMDWAYKNGKTSLRTREKACKPRNGERRKEEENLVIGAPEGWQTVQ